MSQPQLVHINNNSHSHSNSSNSNNTVEVEEAIETMVVKDEEEGSVASAASDTSDTSNPISQSQPQSLSLSAIPEAREVTEEDGYRQWQPRDRWPHFLHTRTHTGNTGTGSSDHDTTSSSVYKPHQRSKLRSCVMNGLGLLLIVGGAAWAIWHSRHSPKFSQVHTGQPTHASLCTSTTTTTGSSDCKALQEWQRPCALLIQYNFSLPVDPPTAQDDEGFMVDGVYIQDLHQQSHVNQTLPQPTVAYTGHDVLPFGDNLCHERVDAAIQTYLNTTNFSVYYDPDDPQHNNHYHQPHPASAMAAIIASVSCGVGILLLCTSLLECLLQ